MRAAAKRSDLKPGVFLRRPAPDDDTLPARVGDQIRRKLKKLALYKAQGYTTVLLIESKDQALMNQYKMLEAARESVGGSLPEGLDQLWYAEVSALRLQSGNSSLKSAQQPLIVFRRLDWGLQLGCLLTQTGSFAIPDNWQANCLNG